MKNFNIFTCPSATAKYGTISSNPFNTANSEYGSYGISISFGALGSLAALIKPAETIMLADSIDYPNFDPNNAYGAYIVKAAAADPVTGRPSSAWKGQVWGANEHEGRRAVHYRHNEIANFAFADGHVKAMKKGAAERTADQEGGVTLSGNNAVVQTNIFVYWNNAGG